MPLSRLDVLAVIGDWKSQDKGTGCGVQLNSSFDTVWMKLHSRYVQTVTQCELTCETFFNRLCIVIYEALVYSYFHITVRYKTNKGHT